MLGEGVHWTWALHDQTSNIERDGESGSRWFQLPLFRQLPHARPRMISRSRSWRSSSLWVRARWLLIGSRAMASESEFFLWLVRLINEGAFGAVTLAKAKKDACEELALDDETILRYLARVTSKDGPVESDGEILTLK